MKRILFLCTGNSCRSQMAEGWARHLWGDDFQIYSAGIEKHGLHPLAVKVMAEAGVDISSHYSKLVDDLPVREFDYIVTVCDNARETCPLPTGKGLLLHQSFDDPPRLAQDALTEDEKLDCYRRVCDEIRSFIVSLPAIMQQANSFC